MKIEIVDKRKPELKAGQLWQKGTDIYLAIENATTAKGISLVLTNKYAPFTTTWSHNNGFGHNDADFEYIGDLKITL